MGPEHMLDPLDAHLRIQEPLGLAAPDQPPDLPGRRIGTAPRGDGLGDPRVAVQNNT
ncbi:hypothetical protein GCM10010304_64200 [Streptomyces roseoviolaceus]